MYMAKEMYPYRAFPFPSSETTSLDRFLCISEMMSESRDWVSDTMVLVGLGTMT